MRDTRDTTAQRRHARTTALATESALMVSALARMVGVVRTVLVVVLEKGSTAVETESALRASATATLGGPATPATFVPACTTALVTDTATTEPAFARRDTVAVIAHFRLSPSLASAQFTAFVAAFSSALKSMRPKVLDHHMIATPLVPRSACPNVLLERCPSVSLEQPHSPLSRSMCFPMSL